MARHRKKVLSPVSVIVTVLNEVDIIETFISVLALQDLVPDRVIIIDGGSTDGTLEKIQQYKEKLPFELVSALVPGNRSVGRNIAIGKYVQTELVAITDAGCFPHRAWLQELLQCWQDLQVRVVAGYARVLPDASDFQLATAPFFLVMEDKVDPAEYLPATRSMLLEKSVWQEVGGFDETLTVSEDFAFAHSMIGEGVKMGFCLDAYVFWLPPETWKQFAKNIYSFARDDVVAGLYRPKVALVFARYAVGVGTFLWYWTHRMQGGAVIFVLTIALLYSIWAIMKLRKYMPWESQQYLPGLQIVADLAVMTGTIVGLLRKLHRFLPAQE